MKQKSILLSVIVVIVLLSGGFLLYMNRQQLPGNSVSPKKIRAVDVGFAGNKSRTVTIRIDATVESREVVNVAFEVRGKLEKGELQLEPGTKFKKGQLLYKINNREAFAGLSREKAQLAALVLQIMPVIESEFPGEKNKWTRFMEELKPSLLLPELPKFTSSEERYLVTEKGILERFYQLQQAEIGMANYFYLAPFDGIVLSVSEQPGNIIRSGKRIARIGTEGPYRIIAAVPRDYLETFGQWRDIRIVLPNGNMAGQAQFISRSMVMDTAPTRYYFDASWTKKRHLFHGMPVLLEATHRDYMKSCRVPVSAVDRDLIQLVQDGKLVTHRITISGKDGDTLFVRGLKNGDAYVLRYDFHPDETVSYYPKNH